MSQHTSSYGYAVGAQQLNDATLAGMDEGARAGYLAYTDGFGFASKGKSVHPAIAKLPRRFVVDARYVWLQLDGQLNGRDAAEVAQAQAMRKQSLSRLA